MQLEEVKGRVDFGILTIREDEFEAVLHHFPGTERVTGRRQYNLRRVELPNGSSYLVAILRCIEQGNGEAQSAAHDLLEDLNPHWLLVVGIAGGVPSSEFSLGDVVVSTRNHDFSVEAVLHDKGTEYALAGGPVDKRAATVAANLPALKAELGSWGTAEAVAAKRPAVPTLESVHSGELLYGDEEWRGKVRQALSRHAGRTQPLVTAGAIASSDRLIKDTEILSVWLKMVRQILAIEMESAGVYRAAHGRQVPTLSIRGISDVVGLKRDPAWTQYACYTAAAFALALLRTRPVEPRGGRRSDLPEYTDEDSRRLSEQLAEFYRRKERLKAAGAETSALDQEILALRRQLREGGQLREGDFLGDGRYLLLRRIGRGGFATVWKARDKQTDQHVAIKVLHSDLARDPTRRERFFRGARVMSQLAHTAIVKVLEPHGHDGGFYYFVMEFISGGDLRETVLSGKISREAIIPLILRVGDALALAHDRGFVHRDIKPANILLDDKGAARLTDFDLVGAFDTTGGTRTGAMGTFLYAAPELMARPQDADARADVYGLGMTTLFGLYGQELSLDVIQDTEKKKLIGRLPCNAEVKKVLQSAVSRSLAKRYSNVSEFCRALREAHESLHPAAPPLPLPAKGLVFEAKVALEPLPKPRDVQSEALAALRAARAAGRKRALVVLATGLGKTLLTALDYHQVREEIGHRPRLIFVAHRREILTQAAEHFQRLAREHDPSLRIGWFSEGSDDLSADAVFASVSKLSRAQMLERLRMQRFDYAVIDEVHHAAADSYRRILDALDAGFLLGLTATPERADDGDVLGLFDDFVAYRADISKGISLGHLVPFAYYGVKDEIDYENIPWRNKRFDPETLATAAQTEARMATLLRAWQAHPGTRTLVFCCSIEHAKFVRSWLRERGVRIEAVFSSPESDERESALRKLRSGELDAVCSVDVFNEGVDVREIDRVVMLRPTESNVVFLQQLGRGLRANEGKRLLTVIDFVGNHRVFLDRVRSLLSLTGAPGSIERLRSFLQDSSQPELPAGCSVELELEAKQLLTQLFRVPATDVVERAYQELRLVHGERPTGGELLRSGHDPVHLTRRYGSWFEFVALQGDLTPEEDEVAKRARTLLRDVEQTEMKESFNIVLLEALMELYGLGPSGVALNALATRSREILMRSPELLAEVPAESRPDGSREGDARWRAYWLPRKKLRRAGLRLEGDRIFVDADVSEAQRPVLAKLLRELVDYRLTRYRRRLDVPAEGDGFICRLLRNSGGDPILKLPPRQRGKVPEGERDVRLPDGVVWRFRFAKEFCNVARPPGAERNQLPDLMRSWFGPTAGAPGTSFQVRFSPSPDGLWVEPVSARVINLPGSRNVVAAYPDLRAAAGHATAGQDAIGRDLVRLPLDRMDDSLMAVRVAGDSMNGGNAPLRNGDWAVLRLARGAAPSAVEGRVVLVESPADGVGAQYQLKRLVRRDGTWQLISDNPTGPSFPAREGMSVIARLERTFSPESLAPEVGMMIAEADLAHAFGLEDLPARTGRYAGHLFGFINRKGMLVSPTEAAMPEVSPRPGETVFVLAQRDPGTWRYLGVGRRQEDVREARFEIPEVDFETWRMWGEGRSASRDLPDEALSVAQRIVDALNSLPETERVIKNAAGNRAFIRGRAPRGGLTIDGGPAGFKPRTVTLTDLAWVVVAARDIDANGGVLDEARVNRIRYLEGTARGATRWIDTNWAIAAYWAVSDRIGSLMAGPHPLHRVRNDAGELLDASFRVEPVGDQLTIIYESRGGTKGSDSERNTDYVKGLEVLLARLAAMDAQITDAVIESERMRDLPLEQRRLPIEGERYPLRVTDPVALRSKISAAQTKVGRAQGAKGSGNSTRRIRLFVTGENLRRTGDEFARQLSGSQR